jgi:hypothetical protein
MRPVMAELLLAAVNLMRLKGIVYDMGESIDWKKSYLPIYYKLHFFPKLMIFNWYDISCS